MFKSYAWLTTPDAHLEDITQLHGDMNFIFECWKYILRVSEGTLMKFLMQEALL